MSNNNETIFAQDLFKDKTVLITGGGTGIGLGIAELLGQLGARVIIASRTVETLQKSTEQLRQKGIEADFIQVNVRDEEEVSHLFEQITTKWGTCHFLVNNAGGQFVSPALNITPNGFRSVVDLNLQGTWNMTHYFANHLVENDTAGKIVNIVMCTPKGFPGMMHSSAARAGVMNMTQTLAFEWGRHNILVNSIAPGIIDSSGLERYDKTNMFENLKRLPVSRLGTTKEIAESVAYLFSPAGNFITGTTMYIDGGEHLLGSLKLN